MEDRIDGSNFVLYAARHYRNSQCYGTSEFYSDLRRFRNVQRLVAEYRNTGSIKERLVLNQIITIYNVFEPRAATRILFLVLEGYHEILKPFLELLGYLPDNVCNIGQDGRLINTKEIISDSLVQATLAGI